MPLRIGKREFTKQQTIFLSVIGFIILVLLLVLIGVLPGGRDRSEEINLVVWGVDEDTRPWKTTISRFESSYANINVTYESVDSDNYENELLNALAAGRGPDIFMFHSKWLLEHGDKVVPAPSDKIAQEAFRGLFPQVVEEDFVGDGRIYAMPLSADTLALVYNRDIFDRRGVVFPPTTWGEFESAVAKIRTFENGALRERAAAIGGTSASIPNAVDLLGLMILQEGGTMVNDSFTRADFGQEAENALSRYTRFANPQNPFYTWSDSFGDANEAFANEDVAMIFAYPNDVKEIQDINSSVDLEIAKMPQINKSNPVNFANYWGLTVSSRAADTDAAWNFVIFATTDRGNAENYATETGHAPALRSLISSYLNNPDVGVFAEQALTAKSWPQINDDSVDTIFNDMIKSVLGGATMDSAVSDTRAKLNDIIRSYRR